MDAALRSSPPHRLLWRHAKPCKWPLSHHECKLRHSKRTQVIFSCYLRRNCGYQHTEELRETQTNIGQNAQRQDAKAVWGDAHGSVDISAAGVDYFCSLRVFESHHKPVQKYTNWWVCSGGEWSWRRTKITEPRQERMGLESNVCAGRIFWTRSNPSWQGECCYCQRYIKLAYREETLIRPFECSLHLKKNDHGHERAFAKWGWGWRIMGNGSNIWK